VQFVGDELVYLYVHITGPISWLTLHINVLS